MKPLRSTIPFLIISLPNDDVRRAPLIKQLQTSVFLKHDLVYGVDGQLLPHAARFHLASDRNWSRYSGTIGCFLSHVAAWEKVAASSAEFCIIAEDDTTIVDISLLENIELPEDADVVFINARYAIGESAEIRFIAHNEMLALIDARDCALGNEGYALKPAAARKMLASCADEGFYGHVDGRLLRYCSSHEDVALLPADSKLRLVLTRHHHPTRPTAQGICKAYGCARSLIRHRGEKSVRESYDASTSELPLSSERSMLPRA